MRHISVLICLIMLSLAPPALAQELWRGFSYGESLLSVRQHDTSLRAIQNGGKSADGATIKLRQMDYAVGADTFDADFYFVDDKLDQIVLVQRKPDTGSCQRYSMLLEVRYGKILPRETMSQVKIMNWMTPSGSNVMLFCGEGGAAGTMLNIYYQFRIGPLLDRL